MKNSFDSIQVFNLIKQIPKGKVVRYKDIARYFNKPKAARTIGNILNKNKKLIIIPCHRVIKSSGEVGGYVKGEQKKISLLKTEGITIFNKRIENLSGVLYQFK